VIGFVGEKRQQWSARSDGVLVPKAAVVST
jgi:hypothetical protein